MSATAITDEERTNLDNIRNATARDTTPTTTRFPSKFLVIGIGVSVAMVAAGAVVRNALAAKNDETDTDETNE